jgi:putative SOS response-associated peptidase YedK
MCGRYDLNESPQMLALYFMLDMIAAPYSNTDVRPTNTAQIIRIHEGLRLALPARWGLIPSWSKDDKIAQHTFNARGETVAEKASFRAAFKRRRCIVPVSAFFEWRAIPGEKKKQKLRFTSPGQHPLALAGLWEHWQRPDIGETVESYTIITTTANDFMAPIHDRMPVILGKRDWDAWLDPEAGNTLLLQSMLTPCPDEWLECSPVCSAE